jgi:hypothetical protein
MAFVPKLPEHKGADDQHRIWVPARATGLEDVCFIAIHVREATYQRSDVLLAPSDMVMLTLTCFVLEPKRIGRGLRA